MSTATPGILEGSAAGAAFRSRIQSGKTLPLIGVYDVFSARIAAERFDGLFLSGFSFAASAYGLPDIGFSNWRDVQDFTSRVRSVAPNRHILADVDDGFGDHVIASKVIQNLEMCGASAVMMEDQKRPRKCGHYEGKELLPVEEYLTKLKHVLRARQSLFVLARTDATTYDEAFSRAKKFAEAGADGVMIEAVRDLDFVRKVANEIKRPIAVNQLHGGKSPNWTVPELQEAGVSIILYSTPCLFAAQQAMEKYLDGMVQSQSLPTEGTAKLSQCTDLLNRSLKLSERPEELMTHSLPQEQGWL